MTASAVLMRATLFTWCFIDYWLPAAQRGVENRDNGALLLAAPLTIALRTPLFEVEIMHRIGGLALACCTSGTASCESL